jgi:hypothetical protein
LEALWTDRFAVAASIWWSWARWWGPHRDHPRPDRRGRPDQHSGSGGAWAWSGGGRESAEQPPSAIPGGWFWDGNDFPGNQRAEPPGRPDKRDGKEQNDRAGGKDKPSKGKDKGKGKGK